MEHQKAEVIAFTNTGKNVLYSANDFCFKNSIESWNWFALLPRVLLGTFGLKTQNIPVLRHTVLSLQIHLFGIIL